MRYSTEQRIFICSTFMKQHSWRRCRRKFRRRYPDAPVPDRTTICRLFKKFNETGSVANKKPRVNKRVLTEEKLDEIAFRLEISPRKSLRRLAQEVGVSKTSVQHATKLLKLKPYKTRVVHQLLPTDDAGRRNFCNWYLQAIHDGVVDPMLVFFSDETWFHLSGYVNSQNNRFWSLENPHNIHEVPLHDVKIGVWCAISGRRIIGPIFYDGTINAQRYVDLILQPFFAEVTEEERDHAYFMQDNATAHTAHISMREIVDVFEDRIVSRGLWPPRSPDINPCDFYLWGKLKSVVMPTISIPWMSLGKLIMII